MPGQDIPPEHRSRFDGLSHEIGQVIRDREFQSTAGKFVAKRETGFKIIKGIGFSLAVASGLFGYLLAANSEADDRKANMIHKIIDEKKGWMIKVADGILQLRKTRYLIKHDCDFNKRLSPNEQEKTRFLARYEFIKSFMGVREIFGDKAFQACVNLVQFDQSIKDVCSKRAPDDEAWKAFLIEANQQMRASIKHDMEQLDALGRGLLERIFKNSLASAITKSRSSTFTTKEL